VDGEHQATAAAPDGRRQWHVPDAHTRPGDEVARLLGVDPEHGLHPDEAAARLGAHGPNALPEARQRPLWQLFLDQFRSVLVGLLGAAAVVAFATGDPAEGVAILAVLLLNALVGFATEWRARQALDALRRQAHATARVRRGGREHPADAADLVPGDVVVLSAGDRVPADVRLLSAASLRAEESALTGESAAVAKHPGPAPADAPLAERHGMLHLGTAVAAGSGVAVVTATGPHTELGHIGRLVAAAEQEATPLERRLDELGRRLVYLVTGIAVAVFVLGWLRGPAALLAGEGSADPGHAQSPLVQLVEVAISLAVAAVPEGLPAVTTLVLALGVLRMARQNALVRRLSAVETLGSTTVICSDKTGTLTQNRMTVQQVRPPSGEAAYTIQRNVGTMQRDVAARRAGEILRLARVCVLCNEAAFDPGAAGDARATGDPTETALLLWAADTAGVDVPALRAAHPQRAAVPFSSETRRMITVHDLPAADGGGRVALLKGAPSAVLALCGTWAGPDGAAVPLTDADRARFVAENEAMAADALRVLALAERPHDDGADPEAGGYTLLGLVGMIDPPRPEAAAAIAEAHAAGIRTVMLTGDQIETARAIARQLGLNNGPDRADVVALHARDLEGADPARLAQLAREADVFARVSPEDKLRIVAALQGSGEVVAVTGDGVNDAPALKKADIGVAMGERGTEVAKEAADVVLSDDNFATIVRAVAGGRTIYANLLKFVHFLFACNLAEVLTIFAAVLLGWPLPLLPLQILWVNLVTDVFPALALAVEPADPDVMRRRPRPSGESLLSPGFLGMVAWQGAVLALVVLACYRWALDAYGPGAHARTIALLSLVGVQGAQLFNSRSRRRSGLRGLAHVPYIWAATGSLVLLQALALYLRPLGRVLGTVPPNPSDWAVTALSFAAPVAAVEVVKLIGRLRAHPAG
jgi:Ca2+-transporting ATPase